MAERAATCITCGLLGFQRRLSRTSRPRSAGGRARRARSAALTTRLMSLSATPQLYSALALASRSRQAAS